MIRSYINLDDFTYAPDYVRGTGYIVFLLTRQGRFPVAYTDTEGEVTLTCAMLAKAFDSLNQK